MRSLVTGAITSISLFVGLAVGGCSMSNDSQPSGATTGGATTGGVTSRGGIGSTGIDGSTTQAVPATPSAAE